MRDAEPGPVGIGEQHTAPLARPRPHARVARSIEAAALLLDLERALFDGHLLPWCVRWAPDAADPLPDAWADCEDDTAMFVVARRLRLAPPGTAWSFCYGANCDDRGYCPACCAAIRRTLPTLTLAAVLAAARRGTP